MPELVANFSPLLLQKLNGIPVSHKRANVLYLDIIEAMTNSEFKDHNLIRFKDAVLAKQLVDIGIMKPMKTYKETWSGCVYRVSKKYAFITEEATIEECFAVDKIPPLPKVIQLSDGESAVLN